jgi:hypothetical protein
MLSSCHLRELIDIGLARREQCGNDAASPFGKLVTMRAGDLAQEAVAAQQSEFAGDCRRAPSFFLGRALTRIE